MSKRKSIVLIIIALIGGLIMSIPNLNATIDTVPKSHEATYLDGKFQNATPIPAFSLSDFWQYLKRAFTESTPNKVPEQSIPVLPITQEALTRTQQDTLWRLGHSSILLKLNNEFWLLDPVFSERASPFQFAGPKRFHQARMIVCGPMCICTLKKAYKHT